MLCAVCSLPALSQFTCLHRRAVYYCSDNCRGADFTSAGSDTTDPLRSHKFWCEKMAQYVSDSEIVAFPFPWADRTADCNFGIVAYSQFLQDSGITNDGLWQREFLCHIPYGELDSGWNPFILPSESVVLENDSNECVVEPRNVLESWEDYYSWRKFSLQSPIAILLQWPLTMYFILCKCLPIDYPDAKQLSSNSLSDKSYVVHCVGVEKEADLVPVFAELSALLPTVLLHIHLIGPQISSLVDGQVSTPRSTVTVTCHRGLYHAVHSCLPVPDVVIGFNAGLVAYQSWIDTVKLLAVLKIPAYFTEFCVKSYELTRLQIDVVNQQLNSAVTSVRVSEPILNPFRSPIRKHDLQTAVPAFSNAVIFHLEY